MALLEIKNFYKKFNEVEVLKGIDLSVEKGEVVSIIGSSGSGKSTLLRCINFLERADEGIINLEGEELFNAGVAKKYSEKQLREKRLNFGLVFQSFNLFPQYNVIQNVKLAPSLLIKPKAKALKKVLKSQGKTFKERKEIVKNFIKSEKEQIQGNALELIEKINLTDKIKSYPCELSGGQQQRVAIARALALNPKVLCFDEPTSALDPELTAEVLEVIKSLKEEDRTMIIVTHEMGFAKNVSDKIVFMSEGVIKEQGSPKELLESPKTPALKQFLSNVNRKDTE